MGKVISLNYIPTERQGLAHLDGHRELGFGGGLGGGKSKFLVVEAYANCVEFPGNRLFLGRKVGRHLRQTTIETWKDTIPMEGYVINEQRGEIKVKTSGVMSQINYGGLNTREEIDKFKSAEYGGIYIDQAEELEENDFLMLLPRVRLRLPDGTYPRYKSCFSANPAECAFRQRFVIEKHPDRVFIQALAKDNPYLAPGYIVQLRSIYKNRPELLAALLDGSWDMVEGTNVAIRATWVHRSAEGNIIPAFRGKVGVSVDVSRYGDDETVIYGWDGARIIDDDIYGQKDTNETASRALIMCKKIGGDFIVVDGGGVGGGVVDALRHMCFPGVQERAINIIDFNGARKADNPDKFYNLRAEAYWESGELFSDNNVVMPKEDVLLGQLSGTNYSFSNGRILMDDKDEIKKRIGRSPDRADAVVMGLWALKRQGFTVDLPTEETSTQRAIRAYNEKYSNKFGSYFGPEK